MNSPVYRFEGYRLDPARRELWYGDTPVVLQPKSFDCLVYLIEHRQRAVGRDELISAVWGKVNINGALLRQAILNIRRAIVYVGAGQDVVRTVSNFGYRWNVDVGVGDPADSPLHPHADLIASPGPEDRVPDDTRDLHPADASRARPLSGVRSHAIRWLSVLPVVLVLIGVWSQFDAADPIDGANGAGPACADGEQVLDVTAVLPVGSRIDDDRLSWVRLGLMESIITRLGKGGMQVVPSEDIIMLGNSAGPTGLAEAVRHAVCVRYLVTPHVQRVGPGWVVRLVLQDSSGDRREIEAQDPELVAAARNASDHLLVMLGHATPAERGDFDAVRADEWLARIDIALVTDDLVTAARLIDTAPAELQASDELRWSKLDLEFRRGDFESVRERLSAIRNELAASAPSPLLAKVLSALALVEVRESQPSQALALLNEAVGLLQSPEQIDYLANAHNTRGLAHAMLGNYAQASSDFAAARLGFTTAGRMIDVTMVDLNEGMVLLSRNRPTEALVLLEPSAERAERFKDGDSLAFVVSFLAAAHLALLQPDQALQAFERFGVDHTAQSDSYIWCQYEYYWARTLAANGRLSEARHHLEGVLQTPIDYCREDGLSLGALARLDLQEGQTTTALAHARKAVDKLNNLDDARERAEAWLITLRALHRMQSVVEIEPEMERFNAWAEEVGDPAAKLHARLADAEHAWHERRFEQAQAGYEEALQLARAEGVPADVVAVASSYGQALLVAGDLERAQRVAAQAARWVEHDFDSALLLAATHQALGQREQWLGHLSRACALAGERVIPAALMEDSAARLAASPQPLCQPDSDVKAGSVD